MDHRARLLGLLVERSLALGEFTLAGGARSHYYIDARRTTMSAEGQFLLGSVALAALAAQRIEAGWVGGLTMGADPVAYAVAHRSWLEGRPMNAFSVRKSAKAHGTSRRIEGGLPDDAVAIVVEDTMTTGRSALQAVEVIQAHGARVAAVLTVVDREEGGASLVAAAGLPLIRLFTAAELLAKAEPVENP